MSEARRVRRPPRRAPGGGPVCKDGVWMEQPLEKLARNEINPEARSRHASLVASRRAALTPPPRNNDVGRMLLNAVRHGATELRRLELVAWAGQEAQAIDAHALEAVRLVEARAAADAQH